MKNTLEETLEMTLELRNRGVETIEVPVELYLHGLTALLTFKEYGPHSKMSWQDAEALIGILNDL